MTGDGARPSRGDVRAVVVDIDGTLTDDSRRMSLGAVSALREVDDSGVHVMLASGNVLPVAYAVSTYMGFRGPVVAENGGVVCHGQRVWVLGDPDGPKAAWELLGLDVSQTAAIGDSENDIRMIRGCGWGVAIGNADDRTRAAASFVARGTDGEGVVEGLRWLRLLPE